MGNLELHFHLLPGLDDGPTSIVESVELARAAAAEGTETIVATPHVNPRWVTDVNTLGERVTQLAERLRRERIAITVLPGAELDPTMAERLTQRELELIAHGPPGRRWLLLEAPLTGLDPAFNAAGDELRARGFAVLVAHPERSLRPTTEDWRVLTRELAAGSALQVNAWSLAGLYGARVRTSGLRLLLACPGRVVIASDAHGGERKPSLELARETLAGLGVLDPARFFTSLPRSLLERGLHLGSLSAAA